MKVLNFGSLNIDRTYQVETFVRAGETINALDYQEFLGGKGLNQSVALKRGGAEVYHIGAIGHDGQALKNALIENDIDTTYLQELDAASGHAVIQIDSKGENNIIVAGGTNQMVERDFIDSVFKDFEGEQCIVLLQNEISNLAYIMEKAHEDGHLLYMNPSPIDVDLLESPLEYVDYFILNEVEGRALTDEIAAQDIIDGLAERFPKAEVVLTQGSRGSACRSREGEFKQEAFLRPVVDTTGAGDTFTGHFIAALTLGEDVPTALKKATIASSISIGIRGAVNSIPSRKEVEEKLSEVK